MPIGPDEMREIFARTKIVKRPTWGIVKGYHELPYVCLGEACESGFQTTQVRGKVQVSPQFVIRPPQYAATYDDVFGEENTDSALVGRVFGFLGFRAKPIECKSEHIEVRHLNNSVDSALSTVLDELERREDISTGVIITPNSRYYQVSIERFIATILEDEFSL